MNEKTKDSGDGAEDRRFSPTDWDWAMLLSGEINAIETRSHTLGNVVIGALGVVIAVLIALMGISYSNYDSTNPSIMGSIVVLIFLAIIGFHVCSIRRNHNKYRHRDEDRIKVTTQVPKTTIGGLHYAGTTQDMGHTVTKQGI